MNTKIQKWGNSLAVRIPNEFAKTLKLKEGISVGLKKEGNKMILLPSIPVYTLSDMEKNITSKNGHKIVWQDDRPRGKEIW